ncbi:hypothetical protein BWD09_00945 [Neisseria dentiae]|uniref:Uncharacterized protein n=1 Tax=Neisseria dentiae TaxID=194197 RepID=A0A1X3DGF2_9NEIS|nr:hypothetical protein BWD09_00945 [Neisseria dentiae]
MENDSAPNIIDPKLFKTHAGILKPSCYGWACPEIFVLQKNLISQRFLSVMIFMLSKTRRNTMNIPTCFTFKSGSEEAV